MSWRTTSWEWRSFEVRSVHKNVTVSKNLKYVARHMPYGLLWMLKSMIVIISPYYVTQTDLFEVRSRSGKNDQIFKSIVLDKKHMFLVLNILRNPNVIVRFSQVWTSLQDSIRKQHELYPGLTGKPGEITVCRLYNKRLNELELLQVESTSYWTNGKNKSYSYSILHTPQVFLVWCKRH